MDCTYSNLSSDTRIFFTGSKFEQPGSGTVVLELPAGYLITMDDGREFSGVHPEEFLMLDGAFAGRFQLEEERKVKASFFCQN